MRHQSLAQRTLERFERVRLVIAIGVAAFSALSSEAYRRAKSSIINTEPTMSKPRIQSKTNLFGLGLVAFGFLADNLAMLQAVMSPKAFSVFSIIVGLAVILLREVTTGPVGRR